MTRVLIYIFIVTTTLLFSCNKKYDLLKSTGEIITETRQINSIDTLVLENNIDVLLIKDSIDFIQITAGENLMEKITSTTNSTKLILKNNNKYNWVRSFDQPITIQFHYTKITCIQYKGSGNITSYKPITDNPFCIEISDGSGDINLNLNNKETHIYQYLGCATVNYNGTTDNLYIYNNGVSPFHTESLKATSVYITNNSVNDCYVYSTTYLWLTQNSSGNIYYKGTPFKIDKLGNGTGALRKLY